MVFEEVLLAPPQDLAFLATCDAWRISDPCSSLYQPTRSLNLRLNVHLHVGYVYLHLSK